ncbi:hypothetical protein AOC36_08265 [Erysipelothrix larvae]|uniref:Uncharacterized protein n=1 Tax=Erysipelothrix larvae TaxID=1514105 RepID=A0A0X8H0Z2_9FIRM|nr:iron-containing alcohol dehydrogenase [Erysipelothrix larvae]AMC93979.1 hypothetical protein AOC36_08265 [Erysipelothrix larvae]
MELIKMRTKLYQFNDLDDYLDEFPFGEGDMVVVTDVIYKKFKDLFSAEVNVVVVERYGNQEPTDIMIESMLNDINHIIIKRIIAIGGGSCLDIAKILSIAYGSTQENIDWIFESDSIIERNIQLILIPTTCGTGSEVTSIAAINRTRLGTKVGISNESIYGDCAILIPRLIENLPQGVFATSSIDAFIHATESFLSDNSTDLSRIFSIRAIEMILNGFIDIKNFGYEVTIKQKAQDFILASTYAGFAFETGGCGPIHALSYPLGAKYKIAHGESNFYVLKGVLNAYDKMKPDGKFSSLKQAIAEKFDCNLDESLDELYKLLNSIMRNRKLSDYNFGVNDVESFSISVVNNQKRLLKNSYVPMNQQLIKSIYLSLIDGEK